MIHARMAGDGTLSEIAEREAIYPDDVPLDEMPRWIGPHKRQGKKAVPNTDRIAQDQAELVRESKKELATLRVIHERLVRPRPQETFEEFLQAIRDAIDTAGGH